MRTARFLPYGGSLSREEVSIRGSLSRGVSLQGVSVRGVSIQGVSVSVKETRFPCGQTDACENITLPNTSFAGDNKWTRQICEFLIPIIVGFIPSAIAFPLNNFGPCDPESFLVV